MSARDLADLGSRLLYRLGERWWGQDDFCSVSNPASRLPDCVGGKRKDARKTLLRFACDQEEGCSRASYEFGALYIGILPRAAARRQSCAKMRDVFSAFKT